MFVAILQSMFVILLSYDEGFVCDELGELVGMLQPDLVSTSGSKSPTLAFGVKARNAAVRRVVGKHFPRYGVGKPEYGWLFGSSLCWIWMVISTAVSTFCVHFCIFVMASSVRSNCGREWYWCSRIAVEGSSSKNDFGIFQICLVMPPRGNESSAMTGQCPGNSAVLQTCMSVTWPDSSPEKRSRSRVVASW